MSHVRFEHCRPSRPSQYSADKEISVDGVGELNVADTHGEEGRRDGHSSGFSPGSKLGFATAKPNKKLKGAKKLRTSIPHLPNLSYYVKDPNLRKVAVGVKLLNQRRHNPNTFLNTMDGCGCRLQCHSSVTISLLISSRLDQAFWPRAPPRPGNSG